MPLVPVRVGASPRLVLAATCAFLAGCGSESAPVATPSSRLVIAEFLFRSGADTLEWIELRNDGAAAAPLSGVTIPAVSYGFPEGTPQLPAGGRLLLVNDAALFARRHPGVPVFGVFTGRLADEGENLSLEGTADGGFSVSWSRRSPWPQGAVRLGRSMVWTGGDPRAATSWAASAVQGGEPAAGETPAPDPAVRIGEVLPRSATGEAFVELVSEAREARDIGGWWIVLDGDAPDTLVVPAGTVIPAGGRLVFSRGEAASGRDLGSLDPRPEEGGLLLVARTPTGAATGYADLLEWEALPAGSSVARFDTWSTGVLATPSPGSGETAPTAPDAYIAEICYHPATGAEYVEIASLLDVPLVLGRSTDPDSSWSLEGTGLRFGPADTLPPRGRMVLVSSQDASPEAFRSLHAIAAGVPVLGFPGRLDNSGERLDLGFPAVAVTDAQGALRWRTRVVDEALWLPVAPWPSEADGGGACLERIDPSLPGASPRSWRAAAPSPGA